MAASFPSGCCFYSDKGGSKEAFFCICWISNIFILMFMAIPGFKVGPILPLISWNVGVSYVTTRLCQSCTIIPCFIWPLVYIQISSIISKAFKSWLVWVRIWTRWLSFSGLKCVVPLLFLTRFSSSSIIIILLSWATDLRVGTLHKAAQLRDLSPCSHSISDSVPPSGDVLDKGCSLQGWTWQQGCKLGTSPPPEEEGL